MRPSNRRWLGWSSCVAALAVAWVGAATAQETPAPEMPAQETPAPETPAPETPAPEMPAPETPAPETPAPETPAPETPAPESGPEETADAPPPEEREEILDAAIPAGPTADTGIRGRIVDSSTGAGLADAVVVARNPRVTETAVTDEAGGYVLVVPVGRYSVLAYTDLYHGARMPQVAVRAGRFAELTLTLDSMDAEAVAEEVEIVYRPDTSSANAQDQLRAAATGIGEGMGARQMSRTGASDAGGAARNVVGVTLEGTNLNIRGLGGRYTLVTLNGVPLPSFDPDVPAVDLDLFPTSVIDNLLVSKTFSPNLFGNFAGGALDIRTVRFPSRFTFQLGASVGANTVSTFQDRLTYRGGDTDWLGFDDGTRSLPSGLENDRVRISRGGPYTSPDQLEEVAERFENRWQYDRSMAIPALGVDLTLGDSIDLGGGDRFGFLVTAFYDYASVREVGLSRPRPTLTTEGALSTYNDFEVERGRDEVRLGALGTASLELGQDDVLTFLTLFNRSATDEVERQTGQSGELGAGEPVDRWQLQMIARQLWFNQLRGDHRNLFGSHLRLRWNVFGSHGQREEPDRRTVTYGPQGLRWLDKAQSGERFYSDLEQVDLGGTTDLRIPLWSEAFGTLGVALRGASRDFTNRRFRMLQHPDNMDQSVYRSPVEELFDEQAIGTITRISEETRANDSYHSDQRYYAGFAMLETPLFGPLSFSGGARLEVFEQDLASFSPFESENDDVAAASRMDVDVLPAASLRLQLAEGMVLRAAYGMTVARPQVRELAPYQYYDFVRDRNVQGNPDLSRTLIQNADLRWEWFFGEGELLALSAFYKYFDQPIELQIMNPGNYDAQFINAAEAHNVGGEVELRFNFRHLAPELSFLTLGGNLALVWSTVRLPEELSGAVQSERALYGQAPYVANLSLQVDEPDSGLTAALTYNVVGPRITDVGTRVNDTILPNIERAPFHRLDFVFGWRIEEHLQIKLKVRNLLFQQQDWVQGDYLTARIDSGTSVSLGLQYTH